MANYKEWEDGLKNEDKKYLERLHNALQTLGENELFAKEFRSTGIFTLQTMIRYMVMEKEQKEGLKMSDIVQKREEK